MMNQSWTGRQRTLYTIRFALQSLRKTQACLPHTKSAHTNRLVIAHMITVLGAVLKKLERPGAILAPGDVEYLINRIFALETSVNRTLFTDEAARYYKEFLNAVAWMDTFLANYKKLLATETPKQLRKRTTGYISELRAAQEKLGKVQMGVVQPYRADDFILACKDFQAALKDTESKAYYHPAPTDKKVLILAPDAAARMFEIVDPLVPAVGQMVENVPQELNIDRIDLRLFPGIVRTLASYCESAMRGQNIERQNIEGCIANLQKLVNSFIKQAQVYARWVGMA